MIDVTVEIKDGERTINPNYDSNKFSQTATYIKELEALNIKNREGGGQQCRYGRIVINSVTNTG